MKIDGQHIEFSTGKRKYCFTGTVGLSPDGRVTYGSDGDLYLPGEVENGIVDPDESLTKQEAMELADFMITRWLAFRAAHNTTQERDGHV